MNILHDGYITLNKKNYKYKLFDTTGLIELIRHNKKFIVALEDAIKTYRNNKNFQIIDLVKEYIYYRPTEITTYFIIYSKNIIISTARFYYNTTKKSAYFNLIYTNADYRGQKICYNNIKFLVNISKKYINKYELEVDVNNPAAIKCYENNGFKIIKKVNLGVDNEYYLMRLKI
jgi:hypothetical protein